MATQTERREKTCAEIISAARGLFARSGYSGTSLSDIVEAAGVTTGAIYHHFGDKKGLFIAVARDVEESIVKELDAMASDSGSLFDRFEAGVLNTLEICARPDIQRIVFRDAPTVVGVFEWRKIEIQYGFGTMQKTLAVLAKEKVIIAPDPKMTAQIVLGALMEAADAVAASPNITKALKQAKSTLQAMVIALKAS